MIFCAFTCFCAADADPRTSKSGKPWTRLRVGVGIDEATTWLTVSAFGSVAEAAAKLKKSAVIHVDGSIKLNSWRGNDGIERHELQVTANRIERAAIGENKPKRRAETSVAGGYHSPRRSPAGRLPGAGDFSDDIPFAPEWR